jgi:pimeloyl-ACP methyl ester carboxylesterase
MATIPGTRYAQSGDLSIAYRTVGAGPRDLVVVPGFVWNVEAFWEEPVLAPFVERLASFSRLTLFDKRGQGLSDRPGIPPTLEQSMDDVLAVMDDAEIEKAILFGISEGGPMAQLFAATHPHRVEALVLYGSFARIVEAGDYPHGVTEDQLDRFAARVRREWGGPVAAPVFAPSMRDDPLLLDWWGRFVRRGSGPRGAQDLLMLYREIDTRAVLPAISAPTLVLHRVDDRLAPIGLGRYLAENIPGARLVELEGGDHIFAVYPDQILDEVEQFVTGRRHTHHVDRVLATVLFTDIVGSTERAAALGDRRWRALVERHDALARQAVEGQRGRLVKTLGDGLLATFDGPARAIRSARTILRETGAIGLDVRAGLHTGEVELVGDDVGGMAVNIAARVSALAGAGEVLASSTVRDLVVGSGIEFEDRGAHSLKGVPGEWRLVAAVDG